MDGKRARLKEKYRAIGARIEAACRESGRSPAAVKLLAVSKTHSAEKVAELAGLGQKSFGENYVQEALAKQQALIHLKLDWHFIGALQTNKAKQVVGNFSLIHSVDRLELAQKLHRAAQDKQLLQNCLVEVNIDEEGSKAGIPAKDLASFLESLAPLVGLRVQGLMCIPAPSSTDPRRPFAQMKRLLDTVNAQSAYPATLTELSMGMSEDFPAAIAEGATIVRVGSAIFGAREKP